MMMWAIWAFVGAEISYFAILGIIWVIRHGLPL
jgi:hypothetical protein